MRLILLAAVLAAALPSGVAFAHPDLVSATPAADATIARPTRLTLTFSDALLASASGIELVMTAMPGMADHPPMPIKGFRTTLAADGRTLTAALPRPLPAGTYALTWRVTGADRHAVEGRYAFTVR